LRLLVILIALVTPSTLGADPEPTWEELVLMKFAAREKL